MNDKSDLLANQILNKFKPENSLIKEDLKIPEAKIKTSRNIEYNIITPKVTFKNLVLSDKVKQQLNSSLDLINLNKTFNEMNSVLFERKKYLAYNLHGESGTGKTQTAKAIANYYKKDILIVNYSQLLSKFIGETGKNIEKYFKYAKENDLVLFFDEADTLVANRMNTMNSNSQDTNIFMQNLDEFEGIIILTTNKFQDYDKAMMRRFINIEYLLPDLDMRKDLLEKYMNNISIDFNLISKNTEGLSGGEIINALKSSYGQLAKKLKNKYKEKYINELKKYHPTTEMILKETNIIKNQKLNKNNNKKISL